MRNSEKKILKFKEKKKEREHITFTKSATLCLSVKEDNSITQNFWL